MIGISNKVSGFILIAILIALLFVINIMITNLSDAIKLTSVTGVVLLIGQAILNRPFYLYFKSMNTFQKAIIFILPALIVFSSNKAAEIISIYILFSFVGYCFYSIINQKKNS